MGIFFANPWGLLALFGLPVVVAIHLLRRRSREIRVSTLFLVERALPSSEGGRRIRTLRNSLPLWAQLLAVIALTWLLAKPRWIDETSVQTVVTILDSSASLSAFQDETKSLARTELGRLGAAASRTQWVFLRSDASRLGTGSVLDETLETAFENWNPSLGTHDTGEALRLARTLAGPKGTVLFLTDHPPADLEGVSWISTGSRIENAGFLGGEATSDHWTALLKNFGTTARDVRWRIAGTEDWRSARLEPGASTEIAGPFPQGADRVMIETEGDRFHFDDQIALIRPRIKAMTVSKEASEAYSPLLMQVAELATPSGTSATPDLTLAVYNPLAPKLPAGAAAVFVEDAGKGGKPVQGLVVAENHPLMENLTWQGLIARDTFGVPVREGDLPLLWQGDRPLIFLRTQESKPQLVFNFDVRQSNATRLPAFPILLHRFFNLLRDEKVGYEAANVETRQPLVVAGAGSVQAPAQAGFFSAKTPDGQTIFDGAAQFGDTRESDFSKAETARSEMTKAETIRQLNSRGELLDPLWAALLAGLMLWNWILTGRPKDTAPQGTELKLAR